MRSVYHQSHIISIQCTVSVSSISHHFYPMYSVCIVSWRWTEMKLTCWPEIRWWTISSWMTGKKASMRLWRKGNQCGKTEWGSMNGISWLRDFDESFQEDQLEQLCMSLIEASWVHHFEWLWLGTSWPWAIDGMARCYNFKSGLMNLNRCEPTNCLLLVILAIYEMCLNEYMFLILVVVDRRRLQDFLNEWHRVHRSISTIHRHRHSWPLRDGVNPRFTLGSRSHRYLSRRIG